MRKTKEIDKVHPDESWKSKRHSSKPHVGNTLFTISLAFTFPKERENKQIPITTKIIWSEIVAAWDRKWCHGNVK